MTLAALSSVPRTTPSATPARTADAETGSDTAGLARRWELIRSHPLGESPETSGLPERVAREHGWSMARTRRAIEEYRRFCLLAVDARGRVSPSDDVDAVWHAHLLYTQDYWKTFCPKVLGFDLHHVPNSGASGESDRLADQYTRTLARYAELFGAEAPSDLWAPPGTPHPQHRVVDPGQYWLVPKLSRGVMSLIVLAAVVAVALLSMGAGPVAGRAVVAQADLGPLDLRGPDFLKLFFGAYAVVFVAALALRWNSRRATRYTPSGYVPDPYETAYLSGGPDLAISAAIVSLAQRGRLTESGSGFRVTDPASVDRAGHPFEKAVLSAHRDGRAITARQIGARCKPAMAELRAGLIDHGLTPEPGREVSMRTMAVLLSLAIPAFGIVKVVVGLVREKPVGFLVLAIVVTGIVSLVAFARQVTRTTNGDRVLSELRRKLDRSSLQSGIRDPIPTYAPSAGRLAPSMGTASSRLGAQPGTAPGFSSVDPVTLGIALYGMSILNNTPLEPLQRNASVHPVSSSSGGDGGSSTSIAGGDSGSDSSSSSDSGSSDGGGSGCGGCGGGGD